MTDLLNKLKEWIKVIEKALIGVIAFEAMLVIIIGVASNKVERVFNLWTLILIFCSICYIFLVVIRALYLLKFPGSIIDELQSKRELEIKNKLLQRQTALNEFINTTIQGLNKQTCNISTVITNEHLCDKELQVRLIELLKPVVDYTDVILDTSIEKKFTIGIYLECYNKFPTDYNDLTLKTIPEGLTIENWAPVTDKGILMLKDDLLLRYLIPKNLLETDKVNGSSYEIQSTIKRAFNNLHFDKHNFIEKGNSYTIICLEILEVCSDDYVNGVMFIIYNGTLTLPNDISDILKIFNRVTANYTSKYNSCIIEEILSKKQKAQ